MKITIYNYLNKPKEIVLKCDSFDDIKFIEVYNISGDEYITIHTRQGGITSFDSHSGNKHFVVPYGHYIIDNLVAFSEWVSVKPSKGSCMSFKRMRIMEAVGINVTWSNYGDVSEYRHMILKSAIKHYGAIEQQNKAIEEMAELTQAILKTRSGNDVLDHVIEEIADVEIMLEQLKMIYANDIGDSFSERLEQVKQMKVRRLFSRLVKEGGAKE